MILLKRTKGESTYCFSGKFDTLGDVNSWAVRLTQSYDIALVVDGMRFLGEESSGQITWKEAKNDSTN